MAYVAAQDKPLPEFEVATIKPRDPNVAQMVGVKIYPGGRVEILGMHLKGLVAIAFRLPSWQIAGADGWMVKDEYNVAAKPSESVHIRDLRYTVFAIEDETLRKMLQALLIDRFQLKFHREMKAGDVFRLVQSGKTMKLRPAENPAADSKTFGSIGYVGGKWGIFATTMPQLAKFASENVLRAPVADGTDLSGSFDYRQPVPDEEPNYTDNSDSFLRFLSEVGLKLERSKGQFGIVVIDQATKPSAN
jgi:uncharacterized protein (TIGR03435 family)